MSQKQPLKKGTNVYTDWNIDFGITGEGNIALGLPQSVNRTSSLADGGQS